jgi:hypothetical protein
MTIDHNLYDGAPPPLDLTEAPPTPSAVTPTSTVAEDQDVTDEEPVQAADVSGLLSDPALGWLTSEFWDVVRRYGISKTKPRSMTSPAGKTYAERLAYSRSTVTLEMFADGIGIPAEYARGYLRAINSKLEDLGVTLRERRLKQDGALVSNDPYTGVFIEPAEKRKLYNRVSTTNRAYKKAQAELKANPDDADANRVVAETEAAYDDARDALDAMKRISDHLPVDRHAFAVFINPNKAPTFLTITTPEEN